MPFPIEQADQARETLERIINQDAALHALFSPHARQANWRYYGPRGALNSRPATVYAYSTEIVDGAYWSWVYQWRPKTQSWEITRRVQHTLRRQAKARALRLYQASNPR